jgi:hypothetical protein
MSIEFPKQPNGNETPPVPPRTIDDLTELIEKALRITGEERRFSKAAIKNRLRTKVAETKREYPRDMTNPGRTNHPTVYQYVEYDKLSKRNKHLFSEEMQKILVDKVVFLLAQDIVRSKWSTLEEAADRLVASGEFSNAGTSTENSEE